jgi:hypothetical protein
MVETRLFLRANGEQTRPIGNYGETRNGAMSDVRLDSFEKFRSALPAERGAGLSGRWGGVGTAAALLLVGGALAGTPGLVACGGAEANVGVKTPGGAAAEKYVHEKCSSEHMESLDTNGDGRADIQRVLDGAGHELCRLVDLDHDGKPDMYEFFDASGTVRRREFCYDETGVVNAIELYQGGKLTQREYDISGQHRIDTWDWFDVNAAVDAKTGRPAHPVRRERDTRGNGRVDQWWSWDADKVTIAVDRTGDGKPDPDATIVLGGASAAAATANPAGVGASADAGSANGSSASGSSASGSSASGSDGGNP